MISSEQIDAFLQRGAVTIDTPLTADQIDRASRALDRLLPQQDPPRSRVSLTCSYYDEEVLELIQHPFFEEVSKLVLRTGEVRLLQSAIITSFPQPGVEFSYDQHIDMQFTRSDLEAVPRRMVCSFFLWLTEVPDDRAPMMFRPGSHLSLIEEWERREQLREVTPRVIGIKLADLPELEFAQPEPVLASAGQVSVLTTAMVHGASVNTGDRPRKVVVITFHDAGLAIGLPGAQQETKAQYDRELRRRLRPERVHIVTDHDSDEADSGT